MIVTDETLWLTTDNCFWTRKEKIRRRLLCYCVPFVPFENNILWNAKRYSVR